MSSRLRAFPVLLIALASISGLLLLLTNATTHPVVNAETVNATEPLKATQITAAGYDAATKDLIIVSKNDSSWPGVDRQYINENLLLTLRAAYDNPVEWPGVTIEFEPQPLPGHLPVYYFGQTDDTHHGHVTFEADRLLKAYSLGKDNVIKQAMSSNVSCYMSVLDKMAELQQADYQSDPTNPQRFWFEPDMKLDVTADATAVTFTQSKMLLQWAYIPPDTPNKTANATAAAQYFVDCFNNNYDTFAAEQAADGNTALYELRVLGEIAALTKWIQDKNLDSINGKLDGIHYPWLNAYANHSVVATTTITATPAITVSTTFPVPGGTVTQSIYGGVDMGGRDNNYITKASANQPLNAALASKPAGAPPPYEWECTNCPPCGGSLNLIYQPESGVSPVCPVFFGNVSTESVDDNHMDKIPSKWTAIAPANVSGGQANIGLNGSVKTTTSLPADKPKGTTTQYLVTDAADLLIQLTFDWAVAPPSPNPSVAVDFLHVRLREPDGDLITTLYSIDNTFMPTLTWQTATFDVTSHLQNYLDQDVVISFESATVDQTVFAIDNVYLDSNIFPVLSTTTTQFDHFIYLPFVINQPATTAVQIESSGLFLDDQLVRSPNEALDQTFEPGTKLQYLLQEN